MSTSQKIVHTAAQSMKNFQYFFMHTGTKDVVGIDVCWDPKGFSKLVKSAGRGAARARLDNVSTEIDADC